MRVFNHPNLSTEWKCPICNKTDDKEVVLIGKAGTQKGNIIEAEQVHLSCIDLLWDRNIGLMYQVVLADRKG